VSALGSIRRRLFGLSEAQIADSLWVLEGDEAVRGRQETIIRSFLHGYHAALADQGPGLVDALAEIAPELRGFSYEGAGMGLALRVLMTPGSTVFADFFGGPDGSAHLYMGQVGAGWAMARFPLRHAALGRQLDPIYGWLAWDGYGFHQAFFSGREVVDQQGGVPARADYAPRAFDQGMGRALWFIRGARPAAVDETIARFPEERRGDLWNGVGLAATYAGCVDEEALVELARRAGPYRRELRQGCGLAVITRLRAGNPAPHVSLAAQVLLGEDVEPAAARINAYLSTLPAEPDSFPRLRRELLAADTAG